MDQSSVVLAEQVARAEPVLRAPQERLAQPRMQQPMVPMALMELMELQVQPLDQQPLQAQLVRMARQEQPELMAQQVLQALRAQIHPALHSLDRTAVLESMVQQLQQLEQVLKALRVLMEQMPRRSARTATQVPTVLPEMTVRVLEELDLRVKTVVSTPKVAVLAKLAATRTELDLLD